MLTRDKVVPMAVLDGVPKIDTDYRLVDVGYKLPVSIGICAYNEEANIWYHLTSLLEQRTDRVEIKQIVVVSSACTDRTDEIVKEFCAKNPRIELIRQAERKGKSSAVNLFLQQAKENICVLVSADTYLPEHTIENLCMPFLDDSVGIVGGRPVPLNRKSTLMGFVSHYIWDMAHEMSIMEPKLGEMIAFRNIVRQIPEESAVDEASIEAEIKRCGYESQYVPEARVYNKGPETIRDYIRQRRRIHSGHLYLKSTTGYQVSTMSSVKLFKLVGRSIKPNWKRAFWIPVAILLEAYSRLMGTYDFRFARKNPYTWDIALSTKILY